MILTAANLLLYAYNADAAQHQGARRWLEEQLSAPDLCCFSWQTIAAFLRISPRPARFSAAARVRRRNSDCLGVAGASADGYSQCRRETLDYLQ